MIRAAGGELQSGGAHIFLEMGNARGAGDGQNDGGTLQ